MNVSDRKLSRRNFLAMAAGVGGAVGLGGCSSLGQLIPGRKADSAGRPPNIIIIFADDLGYADLGCFGSEAIRTPHLDRMAAEGMKFTDFYVCESVCTPSRAGLMTGRYAIRSGLTRVLGPSAGRNIEKGGISGISDYEITIADILKEQGYATACVGKWHLGHLPEHLPTRHGFDSYFGLPYSNDMHKTPEGQPDGVPLMRNEEIIELPVNQETLTRRYTEEAVQFIKSNRSNPFFLYFPHTFPHTPLYASEKFKGKSNHGIYGDAVEELDWSVGQVLDTLSELGIDENTLIIFTSDNGPAGWASPGGGSAGPLRAGKATSFEGGLRVPGIMRWPGKIPAGQVCSEIAATIDFLPTLAALGGGRTPDDRIIDGKDIAPLMFGRPGAKTPHHAYFYYRYLAVKAVRSGRWKVVLEHQEIRGKRGTVPDALYDLEVDIGETTDLSKKRPEQLNRLLGLIERHKATVESPKQTS